MWTERSERKDEQKKRRGEECAKALLAKSAGSSKGTRQGVGKQYCREAMEANSRTKLILCSVPLSSACA